MFINICLSPKITENSSTIRVLSANKVRDRTDCQFNAIIPVDFERENRMPRVRVGRGLDVDEVAVVVVIVVIVAVVFLVAI